MKLEMAKAHFKYLAQNIYFEEIEKTKFKDSRILPLLTALGNIYALKQLKDDSTVAFASGFLHPDALRNIRLGLDQLIQNIRP